VEVTRLPVRTQRMLLDDTAGPCLGRGLSNYLYEEGPDVKSIGIPPSGLQTSSWARWGEKLSSLYRFLMGRPGLVGELRLVQFSQGRQMRPDT
jgi:hypothetical protein